jgi:hypothetical protein
MEAGKPRAQGRLEATPFVHLVLYLHRERSSGTLVVAYDGRETKIVFRDGLAVAARPVVRASGLQQGLLPLCSLRDGTFAFFDDNLLANSEGAVRGTFDPMTFVFESLREHARDDIVDAILQRYRGLPLRPTADANPRRFGLRARELRLFDMLAARPATVEELLQHTILEEREARRLLYLLVIGKQLEPASGVGSQRPAPNVSISPDRGATPARGTPSASSHSSLRAARASGRPVSSTVPAARTTPRSVPAVAARRGGSSGQHRAVSGSGRPVSASDLPAWQRLASMIPASSRSSAPPSAVPGRSSPRPKADDLHTGLHEAELCLRRDDSAGAQRKLADLAELPGAADNPEYHALRGAAMYVQWLGGDVPRALRNALRQALRLDSENVRALYTSGLVCKREGRGREAARYFKRVVAIDSSHVDAKRELYLAQTANERGR